MKKRSPFAFDLAWSAIPIGQLISHFGGTTLGSACLGSRAEGLERWVYVFISRLRVSLAWCMNICVGAGRYVSLQRYRVTARPRCSCPVPRSCKMLYTRIRVKRRLCRREHCCSTLFPLSRTNTDSQGPHEKSRCIHHRRRRGVSV